jgi:threonine/homoserine/homoserine lactone efflux protein
MPDLLPSLPLLAAFLAASFVLAVTPGPGVLYIVTRSATQGRGAGLASVAGVALGNLGNAMAASLGLAAVFAISSAAFVLVKYLGAAYLVYLGVRALASTAPVTAPEQAPLAALAMRRIFLDGFVVALFNPKTALFFAAFLPQFLSPAAGPLQAIAMGAIFVLIAATTDSCYALASGAVQPWLKRAGGAGRIGRYLSGGVFIGLGILTAVSGQRSKA